MVQQTREEVRRFVGVASTVVGLVCYALSSSFNRLYGEWNSLKISAYIVVSFIICLAVLFAKAWQHWRIFNYREHFAFLALISTTLYSYYLDRKLKTKLDAYGIISSAAFAAAAASLCMSKAIKCGFLDLQTFFCGLVIIQIMEIKLLLGFVGIGFCYFLNIVLPACLDSSVEYFGGDQDQDYFVIDIASLQRVYVGASSRYFMSLDLIPRLERSPPLPRSFSHLKYLVINIGSNVMNITLRTSNIYDYILNSLSFAPLDLMVIEETSRARILLRGDWIRKYRERAREIIEEDTQSSSWWNKVLKHVEMDTTSNNESESSLLMDPKDILKLFTMHFKDFPIVHPRWIVSGKVFADDPRTSLENMLPAYQDFIHKPQNVLDDPVRRVIDEYGVSDIQDELGKKLKIE